MLVNDNSSPSPWLLVLVPIPKIVNTWFLSSMWPFGIPSCPYFGILEQSVLSEKNALSLEFSTSYQYVCPCLVNSALNVSPLMLSLWCKIFYLCLWTFILWPRVTSIVLLECPSIRSFMWVQNGFDCCHFKYCVPKWFYPFCELLYTCIVLTRISICLSRLLTLIY